MIEVEVVVEEAGGQPEVLVAAEGVGVLVRFERVARKHQEPVPGVGRTGRQQWRLAGLASECSQLVPGTERAGGSAGSA